MQFGTCGQSIEPAMKKPLLVFRIEIVGIKVWRRKSKLQLKVSTLNGHPLEYNCSENKLTRIRELQYQFFEKDTPH